MIILYSSTVNVSVNVDKFSGMFTDKHCKNAPVGFPMSCLSVHLYTA